MLYQLPNGQVIHLSIEEFLNLSDDDFQQFNYSTNGLEPPTKMFYGKNVKEKEIPLKNKDIDFKPDNDDDIHPQTFGLNDLPSED